MILVLYSLDRAYMDGENAVLVISAARSAGDAINRQVEDLVKYLRR